jgi:hypothetical protein
VVIQDQVTQVCSSQFLVILVEAGQDRVILVSHNKWVVIQEHNLSKWVDTLQDNHSRWVDTLQDNLNRWVDILLLLFLQASVLKYSSGLMQ